MVLIIQFSKILTILSSIFSEFMNSQCIDLVLNECGIYMTTCPIKNDENMDIFSLYFVIKYAWNWVVNR